MPPAFSTAKTTAAVAKPGRAGFGYRRGCSIFAAVRIVLASVLKPVTDPRLLARLGRSLAALPGAEVHIVAHRAADCPVARPDTVAANVFLHPLFHFPRLSWARTAANRRLSRALHVLQPDVLIIGAAELLAAGLRWQRRTGRPLVYDVRENYALNLRTQGVFPAPLARLLAWGLARLEARAAPQLAAVLLAERVYAGQLPWLAHCRGPVAIIENKYQPPAARPALLPAPGRLAPRPAGAPLRVLLSGTLSALYGTFDVLAALGNVPAGLLEVWVVGHAPLAADARRLRACAARQPALRLTGIEAPVPHAAIVAAIRTADVGLLPYQNHPSLTGCIPTKLWEYLGEALPVLAPTDASWRAGLPANHWPILAYERAALGAALTQLTRTPPRAAGFEPPAEAFWASEAARVQALISGLRGGAR